MTDLGTRVADGPRPSGGAARCPREHEGAGSRCLHSRDHLRVPLPQRSEMAIEVGQQAPEFDLKNPAGESVSLSAFRGKPVLLVFYPFTFTGVCEGELCRLRDDYSKFEKAG